MDQHSNKTFHLKWGIIATGKICRRFASSFRDSQTGSSLNKSASQLYLNNSINGVLSRNQQNAENFAKEFGLPKEIAVSSEKDFYARDIDIVYIGSVNTEHYRQCKSALENGKHVLCEKPFVMKSEEAAELAELATKKGLFLMEGLWSRLFPIHKLAKQMVDSGILGEIKFINADLGTYTGQISSDNRMVDPEKGGSALRDVGIYVLHMLSFYLKDHKFEEVKSITQNGLTGVDYGGVFAVKSGDILATANCTFFAKTSRTVGIFGTKGNIVIEEIHNPKKMKLTLFETNLQKFDHLTNVKIGSDRVEYDIEIPLYFMGNGMEYEIEHVYECIRDKKIQSEIVPLDVSIYIQSVIDAALK